MILTHTPTLPQVSLRPRPPLPITTPATTIHRPCPFTSCGVPSDHKDIGTSFPLTLSVSTTNSTRPTGEALPPLGEPATVPSRQRLSACENCSTEEYTGHFHPPLPPNVIDFCLNRLRLHADKTLPSSTHNTFICKSIGQF